MLPSSWPAASMLMLLFIVVNCCVGAVLVPVLYPVSMWLLVLAPMTVPRLCCVNHAWALGAWEMKGLRWPAWWRRRRKGLAGSASPLTLMVNLPPTLLSLSYMWLLMWWYSWILPVRSLVQCLFNRHFKVTDSAFKIWLETVIKYQVTKLTDISSGIIN